MGKLVDGAEFLASILSDENNTHTETPPQPGLALTVARDILQPLLDKAATVAPTHGSAMPVLKCFQFIATTDKLKIIATDGQFSLITQTDKHTIHTPGVAVFPVKKLLDITRTAGSFDVHITVTGTHATITIGRASWTLVLQGGEDFPDLPVIAEAAYVAVDRIALSAALLAVRHAASRDPNLASLNIIDVHDGKITATNGPRIQQVRVPDFPVQLRIPILAVDDLLRLAKISGADTIHVGQSDNHLIFRLGTDVFIVNKLAAHFPDLEQTLLRPALENKHTLVVSRAELVTAIKRVRINADTDSSAIAITLAPGAPAIVTITARDRYGNTATDTIQAGWAGKGRTLIVNHAYLTDMINTHTENVCTFKLGDDTKTRRTPLLLRHSDGSVGVIQQMNADWAGL